MSEATWGRRRQAEAVRGSRRRRLLGLGAALAFEALVVLILLTIGARTFVPMSGEAPLKTFDVSEEPADEPQPEQKTSEQEKAQPRETQPVSEPRPEVRPPVATPLSVVPPPAVKLPSPLVEMSSEQMASADLRNFPATPKRAPAGPPAPKGEADSEVVGRAPNGETLYAAAWLREPYDSELRGYLSTADPGWALIACKTVPGFKVDDCVGLDEWPKGSRLERAVLAAAWQFKVRPPRVGGDYKVGEWVQIRIDYSVGRRR
ncbi:hypothetical protein GCM10022281_10520 [Sphingomonas rosea]|uniref:Protein TonB n=1 Tax=Sphingomonas rosea TaxID=335605 RepID=A0ABP7TXJ6_9SPHN